MPITIDGSGAIGGGTIIVAATVQAATSGTFIDFTSIPTWARRITILFDQVSVSGTSSLMLQLGRSGTVDTSGYVGVVQNNGGANFNSNGFLLSRAVTASSTCSGSFSIHNITGNVWVGSGILGPNATDGACYGGGSKTLSAALDRVRITTAGGTDTFDAGSINIHYE